MPMKLGATLSALRRKRGLTQEQLADMVGVSAPAVSKWETDASCPDIALLCPLARALDTTIDALLQFEPHLSNEEIADHVRSIIEAMRHQGAEPAERMIHDLLRHYPNSAALKFNLAAVWTTLILSFPTADEATQIRRLAGRKRLLTQLAEDHSSPYSQPAALQLAGILMQEDDLSGAEALLKSLPDESADATAMRAQLHLRRNDPEAAQKTLQKRLYSLVKQMLMCMSLLMDERITPDGERALEICRTYRDVDELFGCGGMYDGLFLHILLRMGRIDDAADCLVRYIDRLTAPIHLPKRALFSPGVPLPGTAPVSSPEMRRMLLAALEHEYPQLREIPRCAAAIEKLKDSLQS